MEGTFIKPTSGLFHLYVLECAKDKFYIGVSKNPRRRFEQHKEGNGAEFTKKYKPIKIYKTRPLGKMSYEEAVQYENLCTLVWKNKLGSDKVSGGDYCHKKISRANIKRKIDSAEIKDLNKIISPLTIKKKICKVKRLPAVNFRKPKLGKKTGQSGTRALVVKCL